jgi:hypothetical protein
MGVRGTLCAALALGLAAAPALAIEPLDGLYEAKLSCSGIANGVKGKYKFEADVSVVQAGNADVLFLIEGLPPGEAYLLTDAKKPDQGSMSGLSCTLAAGQFVGAYQGVSIQLDVKTKAGKDDASLKGTVLLYDRGLNAANVCKLTAKRVSEPPLKLAPCPLL